MPHDQLATNRATLNVESLESRLVPTTFGPNQGLSISVGNILSSFPLSEYVTGTGPGVRAQVRIFDHNGVLRYNLYPFGQFTGGVYVRDNDIDGDGVRELICATGPGTTGRVKVYSFQGGGVQLLANFTPFGPNYTGGVQIAVNNITGSPTPPPQVPAEIICGQQRGGSIVKVFAYDTVNAPNRFYQIRKFQAFENGYTGGVSVTAGNVVDNTTGDVYRQVIVGRYRGLPEVRIFDATNPTITLVNRFFAWTPNNVNNQLGVNVQAGSTDGGQGANMQIFVNLKGTGTIRVFDGFTGGLYTTFQAYPDVYTGTVSMVVGAGSLGPPADLIVVAGDGPYLQNPIIWFGGIGSPAGLNGSAPA